MGKLDDYINSLDGKENIDPVVVASTLLELHNQEMDSANNKIASLETGLTDWESKFNTQATELQAQKAKNWDLVNRVPANDADANADAANADQAKSDASMDDFFKKDE